MRIEGWRPGPDENLSGAKSFRGMLRLFASWEEAAQAVRSGDIHRADVLALAEAGRMTSCAPADQGPVLVALKEAGLLDQVAFLPGTWVPDAPGNGADACALLRDGDMIEYDCRAGWLAADITQEGEAARRADAAGQMETYLGENAWCLTEKYTRCFLLIGTERAMLIDTGFGGVNLPAWVRSKTDLPLMVCLTHGHWDHAGGARQFPEVFVGAADGSLVEPLVEAAKQETPMGGSEAEPLVENTKITPLAEGAILDLGGRRVEVLACPGHTQGGLCFLDREGRRLFAGDSVAEGPTYLFLDHSDPGQMTRSLQRLLQRRDDFDAIYASHRTLVLDASWMEDMIACIAGAEKGTLAGQEALIAKTDGPKVKYSYGKVSIFLPCGDTMERGAKSNF